eukprot:COSAG01_NODE_9275_length_2496_cov_1.895286_3_plen_69_part_00
MQGVTVGPACSPEPTVQNSLAREVYRGTAASSRSIGARGWDGERPWICVHVHHHCAEGTAGQCRLHVM